MSPFKRTSIDFSKWSCRNDHESRRYYYMRPKTKITTKTPLRCFIFV